MLVSELIAKLSTMNPNAIVEVWDAYNNEATTTVCVSEGKGRMIDGEIENVPMDSTGSDIVDTVLVCN